MRQPGLSERGTGYSGRSFLYLMAPLLCLVILAASISWIVPEVRVPQLETMIATRMLWKHDIEESRFNFFAKIPAKQPLNTSSTSRDLLFKKKWHQGEQIDFVVNSQIPAYWQVHIYDTYTSRGWTGTETERYMLEKGAKWCDPGAGSSLGRMTYTVTTNQKTDLLLMAGRFISSDTTVLLHESGGDIFLVTTPRLLRPDERYTVTSIISSPSPASLSGAGTAYPRYIQDDYLQLPPDFPESVRQLSKSITEEAKTPYEKVIAIDDYLSQIPYEDEVKPPPQGTDGVEHFLFTQKSGYCLHFASAMAVMLRSVGVPSRLVVGYLPGEPGNDVGEYILRDKHYHTWPQAYFLGYGWVDLEATPSVDSEVTIETPWITGQVTEGPEPQDAWLEWEMYYAWQGMGYPGPDTAGEKTEIWNRRWHYSDVLGKSLLYILGGAFLIALIVSPILALRSRFHRWLWIVIRSESASMVYARMCVLASMVRLGPRPQQTPLEYNAELTSQFPSQAEALNIITQAYVENRFGRRGKLGLFEEAKLLKARRSVFDMLLKRLGFLKKLFYRR
jgi:transglutaminase-like putative cysteine protease